MRPWHSFCDEVTSLLSAQDADNTLTDFEKLCLNRLHSLLVYVIDEAEKMARLRLFFSMYWHVIVNTSLDYTINPFSPINQLLIRIAKHIADDNIPPCIILMPSIERVIGSDSPQDIRYASTTIQGEFHAHRFLINTKGNALLSLEEIFYYALCDTDFLFDPLSEITADAKNIRFDLSAADVVRLCSLNSHAAKLLTDLKENHLVRYQEKPSLGYALNVLQRALLRSSKLGSGSDSMANLHECRQPIHDFYAIWSALSLETKQTVEAYCPPNCSESLGEYLLCLFAHTPGIALSTAEYDRVNADITPCSHLISSQLKHILQHFLELRNIPLPGMESQFITMRFHDAAALQVTYENYLRELNHARMFAAENNAYLKTGMPIFAALTEYHLDPQAFVRIFKSLSIRTMSDFMCCLNMLPDCYQNIFIDIASEQNDIAYFDFTVLLNELAITQWNRFFAIIYKNQFGDLLDAKKVGIILRELPESKHPAFLQAIAQYVNALFDTGEGIYELLSQIAIQDWPLVVSYFESTIQDAMRYPSTICTLFELIPYFDWPSLYALLSNHAHYYFYKTNLFSLLYDHLCEIDEERMALVSIVLQDQDRLAHAPRILIHVLQRVDLTKWGEIFEKFTREHFAAMIREPIELCFFLQCFTANEHRCVALKYLRGYLSTLSITAGEFLMILLQFPGCQTPLIAIFKCQLSKFFNQFLDGFSDLRRRQQPINAVVRKDFFFLCNKCLPLLLSWTLLADHCDSFRKYHDDYAETQPDPVFRLYQQFREIEKKMHLQQISRESTYLEKLKLLSEFIRFSKTKKKTTMPFYRELITFYGENFFDEMLKHCDGLLQVHGAGLFSQSDTLSHQHAMSLMRSTALRISLQQRASSMPVQSTQHFFVRGTQMPLQPRLSPQP